jgi:enoyl-CoA hydratase
MAVRYETDGPVVVITIDRPGVANAIDRPTAEELADAFRRFDADESLAVAVLVGAGRKFCAGADLKAMQEDGAPRASRVEPDGDGPVGPTRMLLSKPVIAAVEGHAVAGGLELAVWCDLRVAAENAVFGVYCRRWGIPLMDGGTIRLARLIGHGHALDLILTGRGVSGEEALRMGLANRVVAPGEALTSTGTAWRRCGRASCSAASTATARGSGARRNEGPTPRGWRASRCRPRGVTQGHRAAASVRRPAGPARAGSPFRAFPTPARRRA